jgi:hypothetical protein
MPHSVLEQATRAPLSRLETVVRHSAKADLKNLEIEWKQAVGRALVRAFAMAGLSQKEVAAFTGRDPGQVARWCAGTESAPLAALFAVEVLRQPMVIALAGLAEGNGVEVTTQIIVRRIA